MRVDAKVRGALKGNYVAALAVSLVAFVAGACGKQGTLDRPAPLFGKARADYEAQKLRRDLAVALVAAFQGVSLLTNTLRDPELMAREGRRLDRWIDSLA